MSKKPLMSHRHKEVWMPHALRAGGDELLEALSSMSDGIHNLEESLETHSDETRTQFEKVHEELAEMKKGFVAGDADGHRRWHELQIRRVEEIRRLRKAIEEKTISGLIWASIVGLGSLLYSGFKARFGL